MVNGIYQIVKSGGTDVYSEYEKIPVMEHGDIRCGVRCGNIS